MICFIFLTVVIFNIKNSQINNFISTSTDHVIVLHEDLNDAEKQKLIEKLKLLTYQEVEIKEENNEVHLVIKCPPEKLRFFSDWVFRKKWNLNK